MSETHDVPAGGEPTLTPAQRALLRPTVDQAALERFLRAAPRYSPSLVLQHFSEKREIPEAVEPADARPVMQQMGFSEEEIRAFEQENTPPEANVVVVFIVEVNPPRKPHLRALWDRIEPEGAPGGACSLPPD
jgi:hypothetical protein